MVDDPVLVSGDTNGNGKLDLTETWIFEATGIAIGGVYQNTGSVEGYSPTDAKVTDTDPSNYFGSDPKINIDKVTNGSDGPNIHVGAPVTWTYTVTNTGNVALSDVKVTDDQGVTPVLKSGDTNGNGELDLTETWIYEATGTAIAGQYNNIGSAEGYGPAKDKVTDTDPSSYFGSDPKINIDKVTNGSDGPTSSGRPGHVDLHGHQHRQRRTLRREGHRRPGRHPGPQVR